MPFSAPTIATTGSMAYSQTCSGKPRTIFKMKVNTPPLAIVAKNPVTRGRSFHLPKPQRSIALTRMQQVIAPESSLAILPSGKADFDDGTSVMPAIKPMPTACDSVGFVRLITIEYMAIVQFGVTPPTLGLTVCRMIPIANSIAVIATQR